MEYEPLTNPTRPTTDIVNVFLNTDEKGVYNLYKCISKDNLLVIQSVWMKLNEKAKRVLDSITVRKTFTKTKGIIDDTHLKYIQSQTLHQIFLPTMFLNMIFLIAR